MQKILEFLKNIFEWIVEILSLPADPKPKKGDNDLPTLPLPTPPKKKTKPKVPAESPPEETTPEPTTGGIVIDPNFKARKGFNRNFLTVEVPFPMLNDKWLSSVGTFDDTNESELKYHHFSLVMNTARRMPFFTAVNVDGASYEKLKSQVPSRKEIGVDKWFFDPRLPKTQQLGGDFYRGNDFDIGHMVRREDPLWGKNLAEALSANNDTFHYTNACPQHKDFNRNAQRWLGLEDYALKNARKYGLKICVFAGPVFRKNDMVFKNVQVPASYWKIIVMVKDDGNLSATGYLVTQNDLIKDMNKQGFVYSQFETYQVPISEIENLSDIQFSLNQYDPLQNSSKRSLVYQPRMVEDYNSIEF